MFTLISVVLPELLPPTQLESGAITTSSVTLTWGLPVVGDPEAFFLFYFPSIISLPIILEPDSTSYTVTELNPDTEYIFLLTSHSALAGESEPVQLTARTGDNSLKPNIKLITVGR